MTIKQEVTQIKTIMDRLDACSVLIQYLSDVADKPFGMEFEPALYPR